ncbi:MAG: FAD-binding oxidoreductase [Thermoleophilia bacterium]|nr:FAD-binding oxidoreductase [Thermoleophilia bacterium]
MTARSTISRRTFLAGAGAGAAGLALGSCGSDSGDESNPATASLRKGFDGRILEGGDRGYLELAVPTAQRFGATPKVIAECASATDVQRAYKFARDNEMPFAVRGGGHNYAGFSTTDGLLISTRGMDEVKVDADSQTITVGAGVLLGPTIEHLERTGLAIPTGRCNGVGVAGLTLGGGWGFGARLVGLTADSLISTEIVTPDGRLRTASESENADLFWALRGGGGGNFGINTSFTFRAFEVPKKVTVFQFVWLDQGVIPDVAHALMELAVKAPREFTVEPVTSPLYNFAIPGRKPTNPVRLTATGQFTGSRADLEEVINPLLKRYEPLGQEIIETDFWKGHRYLADATPVGWFSVHSGFVTAAVSREAVGEIIDWASRWPVGSIIPDSNWGFFSFGGAVGDVAADATAFVHRDAELMFKLETSWTNSDSEADTELANEWLADFYETVRPMTKDTAYVNFCNRDVDDWGRAYYGSNLERLVSVKAKWDPDNSFRFEQSIPTSI